MANHTHRILRNYRKWVTSTSYSTLETEPIASFYGAGSIVGTSKWVAYGMIEGVLVRPSTGADGQRYDFLIYKSPNASSGVLISGSLKDVIGTSSQFINARISGTDFLIEGRLHSDNGSTGILSITLDLHFIGGAGPTS